MQGTMQKHPSRGWEISYVDDSGSTFCVDLHPQERADLAELDRIFDNLDARILAEPNVEFELVHVGGRPFAAIKHNIRLLNQNGRDVRSHVTSIGSDLEPDSEWTPQYFNHAPDENDNPR
jgi:hypothetical protein